MLMMPAKAASIEAMEDMIFQYIKLPHYYFLFASFSSLAYAVVPLNAV